jgi:hypothetical protein
MKEKIYFEDNKLLGFLDEKGNIWSESGQRIAYLWNELVYSKNGNSIGYLKKGKVVIKNNRVSLISAVSKLEKSKEDFLSTTPRIGKVEKTRS